MRPALARHDAIVRAAVEDNHGIVVKMSGDGAHAAFDDPLDALARRASSSSSTRRSRCDPRRRVAVRCGLHAGVTERRDNDFFGGAVNRAARIMSVAHGGQVLLSQAVATLVGERLPPGVALRDLGTRAPSRSGKPRACLSKLVHPGLRRDFPALRSLEATPNNLPQQLTFLRRARARTGRAQELLGKTRLLTLVGAGGLGKTRLSLQIAADVLDEFPDGVWFVELAPLSDGRLVPQAVASVLGVTEEAGRPVIEALVKLVRDRRTAAGPGQLRAPDRRLRGAGEAVAAGGPHLKILRPAVSRCTSPGETSLPGARAGDPRCTQPITGRPPGAIRSGATVRRARRRGAAGIPRDGANAAAVADICRRLDGIPLAIELAAARTRSLSVESIAARLGDRFALLVGGDRTALPRQQTLRALIDWSHDLLTEPRARAVSTARGLRRRLDARSRGSAAPSGR